jgi:replication factor A1
MGEIEDVYEDLDAELSEAEFRERVEERVARMEGLVDEAAAAELVAHELSEGAGEGGELDNVADIEPGMEEVQFVAKVARVGDVREFERDEGEDGRVLNAELVDESGSVRVTFWDDRAVEAADELAVGDVLGVGGRPKDGYNGVEVNVDAVDPDPDEAVDVSVEGTYAVEDLSLGLSGVSLCGRVLGTDEVRTFERDDGSEGRVSNLLVGDETGRVTVTLWDGRADRATELDPGDTVEIVDGYVRERDGALELHVGDRGAVETVDEEVAFEPEAPPSEDLETGQTIDIGGVVRSVDSKRTFERDDGSEGQVRNVRLQDDTGDVRVALWGEKADADVDPGDRVLVAGAEIQDGWQDDIEASAGWQATLVPVEGDAGGAGARAGAGESSEETATGLDAFSGGAGGGASATSDGGTATGSDDADDADGGTREFTGVVVQAGDPVILDDGEQTVSVETAEAVELGQELTVRGAMREGRLDADSVETARDKR